MRAIFIIVLILGISFPWLLILKNISGENKNTINNLETELSIFQTKLNESKRVNKQLVKNLTIAQQARLHAESQQKELIDQLDLKEKELSEILANDWEIIYSRVTDKNNSLVQRLEVLENRYVNDTDDLSRDNDYLLELNDSLSDELVLLEYDYNNLMANLDTESNKNLKDFEKTLSEYENTITAQQKTIKQLTSDNEKYAGLINKLAKNTGNSGNNKKGDNEYRNNRIESLNNTLANRDSYERKQILLNVIPTIPDGIYASELLVMVDGMNSADASNVILSTKDYIIRPVDEKTISTLVNNLSQNDADMVSQLLRK